MQFLSQLKNIAELLVFTLFLILIIFIIIRLILFIGQNDDQIYFILLPCILIISVIAYRKQRNSIGLLTNLRNQLTPRKVFVLKTTVFMLLIAMANYSDSSKLNLFSFQMPSVIKQQVITLQNQGIILNYANNLIIWLTFLNDSLFNFSLNSIIYNIQACSTFLFMYYYFNIQIGFVATILFFYAYYNELNNILFFIIFPLSTVTAFLFFKFKKRLLDFIRNFFIYYPKECKLINLLEFYVVCTPFMFYSILFSITTINQNFNLLMQIIIVHLFSYSIIFKLYKQGQDIGFDYDPF